MTDFEAIQKKVIDLSRRYFRGSTSLYFQRNILQGLGIELEVYHREGGEWAGFS